jgi:hypothetical protein
MVEVGDTGTFYHRTVPGGMEAIVQGIEETPDGDEITLYLEDGTEFIVLEHDILDYHEHELEDIAANEDLCIVEWDPYDSNNSNISTLPPPSPRLSKRARIFGGRRKRSTRKRKQKRKQKRSTRKRK